MYYTPKDDEFLVIGEPPKRVLHIPGWAWPFQKIRRLSYKTIPGEFALDGRLREGTFAGSFPYLVSLNPTLRPITQALQFIDSRPMHEAMEDFQLRLSETIRSWLAQTDVDRFAEPFWFEDALEFEANAFCRDLGFKLITISPLPWEFGGAAQEKWRGGLSAQLCKRIDEDESERKRVVEIPWAGHEMGERAVAVVLKGVRTPAGRIDAGVYCRFLEHAGGAERRKEVAGFVYRPEDLSKLLYKAIRVELKRMLAGEREQFLRETDQLRRSMQGKVSSVLQDHGVEPDIVEVVHLEVR